MTDIKTRIRLRTTAFAAIDYLVNVLILFAYAVAGTISIEVPLKILAVATVFNMIFLGGIATGITQKFRDPSVTGYQILAACGINLLATLLAPQIAYMFMVNLFVPLAYGVLHFDRRGFLRSWILLSVAVSAVLWSLGSQAGIALSSQIERVLFPVVVVLALGRFVAINAEVSRLRARLQDKNKDLASATARLAEMATHDDLTGIWNRRQFMAMLQEEYGRSERSGSGFCVAIVDVDRFKQVNDRYGHLVGNAVLKELATLLQTSMRASDRAARFGGEEFTLLLVDLSPEALPAAMERLRAIVQDHDWERIAPGLRMSISAGVAAWRPDEDAEQLLKRADDALYKAKNDGRNCIRIA